jgi:endoglucanase
MRNFNKKALAVTLAAVLGALSVSPAISLAADSGDINSDSSVNNNDIALLSDYILTKGYSASNADLTGDKNVDVFDLCALRDAVNNPQTPSQPSNGIKDYGTEMNANATMVADFRKGATPLFFASDGWENGDPFDCGWYEENTSLDNNMLTLKIDKDYTGKYNYSGAEYRTADHYHYGYYETSMQAIKNDGVVSSFFTYTGPSEDNPWDEIDIEILGKDTTKVQLNYYTNGVGNHEYMYDLGFDASEGFHTYGFDWQPDHITWYVDGKAVYTAYSNIPQTPGRIMMNAWPGRGVNEWLNAFNGKTPLTARYQWVTYTKK